MVSHALRCVPSVADSVTRDIDCFCHRWLQPVACSFRLQRSPFRCFGSHGYETTLPRNATPPRQPRYSTAALPPLQASTRRRERTEPTGSRCEGDDGSLDCGPCGLPAEELHRPRSADGLAENVNRRTQNRLSLPPPEHYLTAPEGKVPAGRPATCGDSPAKVKRKPPPPVTASVIQSAGGREVVARTGPVPSRFLSVSTGPNQRTADVGKENRPSGLQLQDLFSQRELDALSAASNGHGASAVDVSSSTQPCEEGGAYETDTTKAFKGALKEIDEALKQEMSEGSFGASL